VMNNAKPREYLVFMVLTLLPAGSHVQRKTTQVSVSKPHQCLHRPLTGPASQYHA